MQPDDLISLKDDMVAFIEGHAMRRLPGFITEDLPTVLWEDDDNPDSWKDFVEMAKTRVRAVRHHERSQAGEGRHRDAAGADPRR